MAASQKTLTCRHFLAETVGFEPTDPKGSNDFESCAEKDFSEKSRSELVSLSPDFGRCEALFHRGKAKNGVGTNEMGNACFGEIWHTFLEKCKI